MTSNFPLVGIGPGSEGGINLASFLPSTTPVSSPSSNSSVVQGLGKVGSAALKAYNAVSNNSFLGLLFGSDYRYLTGIIGLLLIAAGIFLFKPVRETVVNISKTAAKGAALAA